MSLIVQPALQAQVRPPRVGVISVDSARPAESMRAAELLDSLIATPLVAAGLVHLSFTDMRFTREEIVSPDPRMPAPSVGDLVSLGKLMRIAVLVDVRAQQGTKGEQACARIVLTETGVVSDTLCSRPMPSARRAVFDVAPALQRVVILRAKTLAPLRVQPPPPVDQTQAYYEFQIAEPVRLAPDSRSPVYPEVLRRAGVEGEAQVRFIVDTTGRVEETSFEVSAATHELFALAVKAALPTFHFIPAEIRGVKVRRIVRMPLVFSVSRGVTSPLLAPPRGDSLGSGRVPLPDSLIVHVRSDKGEALDGTSVELVLPTIADRRGANTSDGGRTALARPLQSAIQLRVRRIGYAITTVAVNLDTLQAAVEVVLKESHLDLSAVCTADWQPSIYLRPDSNLVLDTARVTLSARDGRYKDVVTIPLREWREVGLAHERPGTYTVEVRAAGNRVWRRSELKVTKAACHTTHHELRVPLVRSR